MPTATKLWFHRANHIMNHDVRNSVFCTKEGIERNHPTNKNNNPPNTHSLCYMSLAYSWHRTVPSQLDLSHSKAQESFTSLRSHTGLACEVDPTKETITKTVLGTSCGQLLWNCPLTQLCLFIMRKPFRLKDI